MSLGERAYLVLCLVGVLVAIACAEIKPKVTPTLSITINLPPHRELVDDKAYICHHSTGGKLFCIPLDETIIHPLGQDMDNGRATDPFVIHNEPHPDMDGGT